MFIAQALKGRTIDKVASIHDYHQVYFDDGAILNVYAQSNVIGLCEEIEKSNLTVVEVEISEEEFKIKTESGFIFAVSLRNMNGPEAAFFADSINNIYISI